MEDNVDFSTSAWMTDRMQSDHVSRRKKRTELQKKMYNQNKRERRAAKKLTEPTRSWPERNVCAKTEREILMHGYRIKSKYGVSAEWYDSQLLRQMGVCYICKNPPSGKRLSVDHCHRTGSVRKLLCGSCNKALGFAKENASVLSAMIEYLEEHNNS